jgi:hypothetical protein
MSPLFRKGEDKAEQDAAGAAEFARLCELSAPELAAAIMPAFGPDGPRSSGGLNAVQIAQWLMASYTRSQGLKPLLPPIQRATEALENVGLVEQKQSGLGTGSSSANATPLGEQALRDDAVQQYLEAPSP